MSGARDRMPKHEEIAKISELATARLRRAACVVMNTGLRGEKVWMIRPSMIVQKSDGPWLELPPPRSKKKESGAASLESACLCGADRRSGDGAGRARLSRMVRTGSPVKSLGPRNGISWLRRSAISRPSAVVFLHARRPWCGRGRRGGASGSREALDGGHQTADVLEKNYLVRSKGWAKKLRRAVDQLSIRYETFMHEDGKDNLADS